MTIRSDISIDWAASPRIVEVTSSADDISIQDFYDTLRSLAAQVEALDDDEIVDAGGKEGGIVAVTMTLKNALIKFKNTGTPRTCKVSGGNLFAVDENGQDMFPIAYNDNVTVGFAQSTAAALVETGVSGLTEEESEQLAQIGAVKTKTDNLPTDPTSKTELETIHGAGSWEGATPFQVWEHDNRRLSSRDIDSEEEGDHISSEEQVQRIMGTGFETTEESLVKIKELIEKIKITGGAHFQG